MRQTVRANKAECTGCGACVSICPRGAITMQPDEEGFLYPAVDGGRCVECDLCEKRCPAGKAQAENRPQLLGAQNRDETIRQASSSGGVFTALAKDWLRQGGVVFGAAFDEALRVEHIGAFDEAELAGMRGSKYVQSDAADAIAHAAALLERGIPVLFSGTPCQVSGLRARVGKKESDLLLTVDFICHGVPSPGVFASYLKELETARGKKVVRYTFRDKRRGWKDFSAVATFEDGTEHAGQQTTEPFLYGFLQNLYLRPSCVQCDSMREGHHPSDITIADLWGMHEVAPGADDDGGTSLVFLNTRRGRQAFERCRPQLAVFPVGDTQRLLRYNPSIAHAVKPHKNREAFFKRYKKKGFESAYVMKLLAGPGRLERAAARAAHLPYGLLRRIRVLLGRR